MFFLLSKTLDVLLSPLTWVLSLLLLLVGGLRPASTWPKGRALGLSLAVVPLLYVVSVAPVGNNLLRNLEESAQNTATFEKPYDAVVLLGGLVDLEATDLRREIAFGEAVERLHATYDLLRTGRAKVAIVSSGTRARDGSTEAETLREALSRWGIAKERIIAESESQNTRDNAVRTRAIAKEHGFERLLLVTSAFHMQRAKGCFAAVGLFPDTYPVDYRSYDPKVATGSVLPRARHLETAELALREQAGRWVYALLGYSKVP